MPLLRCKSLADAFDSYFRASGEELRGQVDDPLEVSFTQVDANVDH